MNHINDNKLDDSKLKNIAYAVLDAVHKMKESPAPTKIERFHEFYDIDKDFDVRIILSLLPKKGQYELGMEMIYGDPKYGNIKPPKEDWSLEDWSFYDLLLDIVAVSLFVAVISLAWRLTYYSWTGK